MAWTLKALRATFVANTNAADLGKFYAAQTPGCLTLIKCLTGELANLSTELTYRWSP